MRLFQITETNNINDDSINRWMHTIINYWKDNTITDDFEKAVYGLMNALPTCVYNGPMIRGFGFDPSEKITNPMQLTVKLHKFALENSREMFGWSKHTNPSDLFTALTQFSGSNITKHTMFYLEQRAKGLDCVKLAHTALNFLDIPTDDWKILKRTVHVIDAELEILAPFTNDVHLLGIGFGKEFYDTENLNRAFKRLNKTTQ